MHSGEPIGDAGLTLFSHKRRAMKKRLLFALFFALMSFNAAGADTIVNGHRSVDPATFNLKSIKLGMSPAQVEKAFDELVSDQMNVTRSEPTTQQCTQEHLQSLRAHDFDPPKVQSCVYLEEIQGSSYDLRVDFIEDWPKHPGEMRVYNVEYQQLGNQTDADRTAFAEAVEKRYGKPTFPGSTSFYCPITPARLECRVNDIKTILMKAAPVARGLVVNSSQIFLYDNEYATARRLAQEKSVDELRTNRIKL